MTEDQLEREALAWLVDVCDQHVYGPELVTAQQEYMIARQGVQAVADGSPEVRAELSASVRTA